VEGSAVPSTSSCCPSKRYPPLCPPDRSEAKWRDLRFPRPATTAHQSATLPFVLPTGAKRSGGICGSLDQQLLPTKALPSPLSSRPKCSWACGPPKVMKNGFRSATSLPGSAPLPLVIPTGAQRSGGISVWMLFPGSVFRKSVAQWRDLRCSPPQTKTLQVSSQMLASRCSVAA
jgi:hypothetical protein